MHKGNISRLCKGREDLNNIYIQNITLNEKNNSRQLGFKIYKERMCTVRLEPVKIKTKTPSARWYFRCMGSSNSCCLDRSGRDDCCDNVGEVRLSDPRQKKIRGFVRKNIPPGFSVQTSNSEPESNRDPSPFKNKSDSFKNRAKVTFPDSQMCQSSWHQVAEPLPDWESEEQ